MNLPEPPSPAGLARRTAQTLSLVLAFGLNSDSALADRSPRGPGRSEGDRPADGSTPYLGAIGPPALRFREPETVTTPVPRPVAIGPPVAGLSPLEASVAIANAAALKEMPGPGPGLTAQPVAKVARPRDPAPAVPARPTPPAILPDDTRPQVRAEDFLPFFQIPGASRRPGEANLIIPLSPGTPAPTPLPPSSATYSQTPR